jgi:hypothetical protein
MSERRGAAPQSPTWERGQFAVPRAHVVLWGAILGAFVGLGILFVDVASWDGHDFDLANEGPFLLWAAAIAAQTMAWVLVFPAIRSISRCWRTTARAHSLEVRAATAALLFLGVAISALPPLIGAPRDSGESRDTLSRVRTSKGSNLHGVASGGRTAVTSFGFRILVSSRRHVSRVADSWPKRGEKSSRSHAACQFERDVKPAWLSPIVGVRRCASRPSD